VFIAFASIHGNTAKTAQLMKNLLEQKGCKNVEIADLSRADVSKCVENAFRYSTLLCMASSYDGGVFAPMSDFIHHLQSKAFQNRRVAFIENGSWAPSATRTMRAELEKLKNITFAENTLTIKTTLKDSDLAVLDSIAGELA
jgi:flavorubredoxin